MGYTHYFGAMNWTDEDTAGWKKALPIVKRIIRKYKNLLQYESDDKRKPVANKEKIRFNGVGDNGHETFFVLAGDHKEFCKTARKPYDGAVCAILLVLKAFVPSFALSSDGFSSHVGDQKDGLTLDESWDQAIEIVRDLFGIHYHVEIIQTRGGEDGGPDPYCDLNVFLDKIDDPALVR